MSCMQTQEAGNQRFLLPIDRLCRWDGLLCIDETHEQNHSNKEQDRQASACQKHQAREVANRGLPFYGGCTVLSLMSQPPDGSNILEGRNDQKQKVTGSPATLEKRAIQTGMTEQAKER